MKALRSTLFGRRGNGQTCRQFSNFNASYLGRNRANYIPLTPLVFLDRAATQYPNLPCYVHGSNTKTWREVKSRVSQYASALVSLGIAKNDVVSVLAPNIPATYESHFAVLGAGGVLHTINTRLDAKTIAFQLKHASTKVLLVDTELAGLANHALSLVDPDHRPLLVHIHDSEYCPPPDRHGHHRDPLQCPVPVVLDYESLLAAGDPSFQLIQPDDEWDASCLNYTSGTTGDPKGVVYHHRGAYLNAVSNAVEWTLHRHPKFLWGRVDI